MDETSNRQLHYNRFRYYDPETAQYISPDPIGLAGGDRPYGYVHNPISWVDPLGLANYFKNQLPDSLPSELAIAKKLGVKSMTTDDPNFGTMVNEAGTIKYVVTKDGQLLTIPHTVKGVEISHAVIADGKPVLAAGQAQVASGGGMHIGMEIQPHSGHYHYGNTASQNAASLAIAKAAFEGYGITFP